MCQSLHTRPSHHRPQKENTTRRWISDPSRKLVFCVGVSSPLGEVCKPNLAGFVGGVWLGRDEGIRWKLRQMLLNLCWETGASGPACPATAPAYREARKTARDKAVTESHILAPSLGQSYLNGLIYLCIGAGD